MDLPGTTTNQSEWTVSELSGALRRTLEDAFGLVRLRGEVSGYRGPHSSGHAYFCLKDQNARIDAVIWKGTFGRLKIKPQEGLEVVVTGRITTFPGKSSYQIIVDSVAPAGIGALMALLEERKRKLTAEGLFDVARKRPLPYLPRVIGVVTSPTGSVIRDILHRLADRFPRRVLVWPVRVQGETCADEVAAGIRGFNALAPDGPIPRPDVIIVARGGGSIEDLWGFNEEVVVRAAAESDIPLVSGVGHETDTTLIDFAADMRAPTPTGAAELVVPVRVELVRQVDDLGRRAFEGVRRLAERRRSDLRSLLRAMPAAEDLLANHRQRLDLVHGRLRPALERSAFARVQHLGRLHRGLERMSPRNRLAVYQSRLEGFRGKMEPHLRAGLATRRNHLEGLSVRLGVSLATLRRREADRLVRDRDRLVALSERLRAAPAPGFERRRAMLSGLRQLLDSYSYRSVLARGFALVRDETGRAVRSAAAVSPGQTLSIQFADDAVRAVAEGDAPRPRPPRPRPSAASVPAQGSLFDG